jgi:hypothetical protein
MELYIQVRDGLPYQHPILGNNLRAAFPTLNTNALPPEFARFVRKVPDQLPGPYEVLVEAYVWDGEAVTDSWSIRPMTPEEKAAKIAKLGSAQSPDGPT